MKGKAYIVINHKDVNKETEYEEVFRETYQPHEVFDRAIHSEVIWSSFIITIVKDKD